MSTCSQSASCAIVSLHAFPRAAKSAESIEGAMIAGGDMMGVPRVDRGLGEREVFCCRLHYVQMKFEHISRSENLGIAGSVRYWNRPDVCMRKVEVEAASFGAELLLVGEWGLISTWKAVNDTVFLSFLIHFIQKLATYVCIHHSRQPR